MLPIGFPKKTPLETPAKAARKGPFHASPVPLSEQKPNPAGALIPKARLIPQPLALLLGPRDQLARVKHPQGWGLPGLGASRLQSRVSATRACGEAGSVAHAVCRAGGIRPQQQLRRTGRLAHGHW
jgi:hypothetical protein